MYRISYVIPRTPPKNLEVTLVPETPEKFRGPPNAYRIKTPIKMAHKVEVTVAPEPPTPVKVSYTYNVKNRWIHCRCVCVCVPACVTASSCTSVQSRVFVKL